MVNTAEGSDIVWQFIAKDLTVTSSGRWRIQLDSMAATLRILRVDAAGEMLTEALPGEEELLQRFSAAFNRVRTQLVVVVVVVVYMCAWGLGVM